MSPTKKPQPLTSARRFATHSTLALASVACCPSTGSHSLPVADASVKQSGCDGDVAVQVLGSGGPIADDWRASSGYLLWVSGAAVALFDAGGGVFQRFGAAGARIEDLRFIALSHLHADHSAALPALIKSAYFTRRTQELPLLGPSGNASFPSVERWLRTLLANEEGAYAYLSAYLEGQGNSFTIRPRALSAAQKTPEIALTAAVEGEALLVRSVGVEHGNVPALGYLVEFGETRIGFGGDQSRDNPHFLEMVKDADLLVLHHAIADDAPASLQQLHATPKQLAQMARIANPKQLVLSHHMQRALANVEEHVSHIESQYSGKVSVAEDLDCFVLR